MKEKEFRRLQELADSLFAELDKLDEAGAWKKALQAMEMTAADLPKPHSISFKFTLSVFDTDRDKEMTVLSAGFACSSEGKPFDATGDSTIHRYVVDGEICQVPHDYCPRCWGIWDFKFRIEECPECAAILGEDVKLLLDTDVCPYCESGKVTINDPVCSECGYEVDPRKIVWG
jgi:hypothetical protein